MNRDNVLFAAVGLLAGFVGGYVLHESMAARQPPPSRSAAGASAPAPAPASNSAPGEGKLAAMRQIQQLAAYVGENPDDTRAIRQLAGLNYEISNWQRAAELYNRYLELEGADIDVMTDLGATYRYLGQPREALEQFRNVRDLAPEHWQSRYNEVLVLAFDLDDLPAARAAMSELTSMQPDSPEVARLAAELEKRSEGT